MTTGIDKDLVRDFYLKMTDTELIKIAIKEIDNLTKEAQEIVAEELKRRNLNTSSNNLLEEDLNKNQQRVITQSNKKFEFALLFALLFGPFGVLYVSITYGLILIALGILGVIVLGLVGLILVWIISVVLAITSTNKTTTISTIRTPNSSNRESLLNQLSQLHTLKEKNVITDDIYEQERKKILTTLDKEK